MDGEPSLLYAALVIVVAVLGGLTAVKFLPPRLFGPVPPPLYVNVTNITGVGDRLLLSLNITQCHVKPKGATVLIELNGRVIEEASLSEVSCGSNNLTMGLSPYLVGRSAIVVVNLSLEGGRGYVLSYFLRYIYAAESFKIVNISLVNGAPVAYVSYITPFRAEISLSDVVLINVNRSSTVFGFSCNSTRSAFVGPGTGYLALPLACSYENLDVLSPGDVYQVRGLINVTYFTPYGNYSEEVGSIAYQR